MAHSAVLLNMLINNVIISKKRLKAKHGEQDRLHKMLDRKRKKTIQLYAHLGYYA
jgi:hypothetical protein